MTALRSLALLAALATACTADRAGTDAALDAAPDAALDARADTPAGDAGPPAPCPPNATLGCACDGGVGARRCLPDGRAWSACACETYGAEFFVSPAGRDDPTVAGTAADPFRTPARAQAAVRALLASGMPPSGVVVWVRGGTYPFAQTLVLGAADSGLAGAGVTWRGYPGERARWVGGATLDAASFAPVTSASPAWSRLDPSAQGRVLVADLRALGITDYGTLTERGSCNARDIAALELSIDGEAMPLARWPDPDEDSPAPSETGAQLGVYGTPDLAPDVTGTYTMMGNANGASVFARNGLVGGKQYHLYRWTRERPSPLTAWFLTTTDAPAYPSVGDPFWYVYTQHLGPMDGAQGAAGTVFFRDPAAANHGFAQVVTRVSATQFTYGGTRPSRWVGAQDVWLHGMLRYDWDDCHVSIAGIDPATKTLTLENAPTYGIAAGQPWYAENLLEEITRPGEWYLDRTDGKLYLLPPGDRANLSNRSIVVSRLSAPLVSLAGASYLTLRDLTLESGRAQLIDVTDSAHVRLDGLTLRNAGTQGVTVAGGQDVGVTYAHVYGTGGTGISLAGGDRPGLVASGHFVENSNVHDFGRWSWMYQPGVSIEGVGSRVRHNEIHDSPHAGVLFFGSNEQLIELNDIHDVCRYAADSGAVYSGRDWGARGNVIRHNYVHDVASVLSDDVHAFYLDDCLSGVRVEGNIVSGVEGFGIEHGGGRDDVLLNNVFAHCGAAALHTDARCQSGQSSNPPVPDHMPGSTWDLLGKLEANNYQQDPWRSRYPACAAIPDDWAAITAPGTGWLLPQGTQFVRNVGTGNTAWVDEGDALALPAFADTSNNVPDAGAVFVDEVSGDLRIAPGSAAFSVPGFEDIPFQSIGIQPP